MRKIIFLFLLFLGVFFWVTPAVKAQYTCTNWGNCTTEIDENGGQTTTCECLSQGGGGAGGPITCSPGYYVCNNSCCPSSGGGGSCFLPGTKVETVEGSKNIETMSIGDQVKSFDDKDKVVNASVSDVMKFSRDYYYEIEAGDREGRPYSVKVTAEHPFYAGDGKFVEVKDLKIGEIVYILKDKKLESKAKEKAASRFSLLPLFTLNRCVLFRALYP